MSALSPSNRVRARRAPTETGFESPGDARAASALRCEGMHAAAREAWRETWRAARALAKAGWVCPDGLEAVVSAARGRTHWGAAEGFFDWINERALVAERTHGEVRAWRLGWLDGGQVLTKAA